MQVRLQSRKWVPTQAVISVEGSSEQDSHGHPRSNVSQSPKTRTQIPMNQHIGTESSQTRQGHQTYRVLPNAWTIPHIHRVLTIASSITRIQRVLTNASSITRIQRVLTNASRITRIQRVLTNASRTSRIQRVLTNASRITWIQSLSSQVQGVYHRYWESSQKQDDALSVTV